MPTSSSTSVSFPFSQIVVSTYRMKDGSTQVGVTSPYNVEWTAAAKSLGGRWGPKDSKWFFDVRDLDRIRTALVDVYGHDGQPTDVGDVILRVQGYISGTTLTLAGRELLCRKGRDAQVRFGPHVILVDGEAFAARGGSANHPDIGSVNVTLLVRDCPWTVIERLQSGKISLEKHASVVETSDPRPPAELLLSPEESPVEKLYGQLRALPEEDQAEIRNRLLRDL